MPFLLLTTILIFSALQSITSKQYANNEPNSKFYMFSGISALFAMIFFIIISGFKLEFTAEFLPYSIGFALSYAAALAGNVFAIKYGPLSITALILSCSLIVPTLYGIIFLNDPAKITVYIGILCLIIALVFINIKDEEMKFSLKWIIWVVISFIGNGMCSTVQKMQQVKFDESYKSEFMIVALIIVCAMLFFASFMTSERKHKTTLQCCGLASVQGISNGIVNYLVMVLSAMIPVSVMFPMISAGGIILTIIISMTLYREKLTKMQIAGCLFGTASVVLLSI